MIAQRFIAGLQIADRASPAGTAEEFSRRATGSAENDFIVKKRRRIAVVGLVVAMLAVAVWFALRPREPEYEGRKLSDWTREFATIGHNRIRENTAESVAAVQHIGTNGLPFLIRDLRAKDMPWETVVSWINAHMPFSCNLRPGWVRRSSALEAIEALGAAAEPAIPKLEELMKARDKEAASWAQMALAAMGNEKALPPLMWGLTNSDLYLQRGASTGLGNLRSLATPAVPFLLVQLDAKGRRRSGKDSSSPRACRAGPA